MKMQSSIIASFACLGIFLYCLGALSTSKQSTSAYEIMKKVDTVNTTETEKTDMRMVVERRNKKRVSKFMRVQKTNKNNDSKILLRFTEPLDVKGTSFLTIEDGSGDDEMWIYFSSLRKTRKIAISGSDRSDQFMGSDFTYGDMDRELEDYSYQMLREEKLDGTLCYVIQATPKDKKVFRNDEYSKKIEWVSSKNFVVLKTEYYDTRKRLAKKYRAYNIGKIDNVYIPKKYEMTDVQKKQKTTFYQDNFQVDQTFNDSIFNTRYLERPTWSF